MVRSGLAGVVGERCAQKPDESSNAPDCHDLTLLDNILLRIPLVEKTQEGNTGEPNAGDIGSQHVVPVRKLILPQEIPNALNGTQVIVSLAGELAWETLVRWRSGDGVVHAAESPGVVDQQVYVAGLLGDLGHGSIQRCFVSHISDDRYYVPVDLRQSVSIMDPTSLGPCNETYRVLFGCSLEDLLTSAEDVDFRTVVFKSSSNHQPDTCSTASHDSNKAVDGEEV